MKITKFYPYPSIVCGRQTNDEEVIDLFNKVFDLLDRLSFERTNSDGSNPFARRDTVLTRTIRDNKTAIRVELSSGKTCYIGFYDGNIYVGASMFQEGRFPVDLNFLIQ